MVGQPPPGLSWGDVGEEHLSQPRNAVCEEEGSLQAVWETAGEVLRKAVEVLGEGSLQSQVECGEGMLYPHCLRQCLEG